MNAVCLTVRDSFLINFQNVSVLNTQYDNEILQLLLQRMLVAGHSLNTALALIFIDIHCINNESL
jgi:hypothetical protein